MNVVDVDLSLVIAEKLIREGWIVQNPSIVDQRFKTAIVKLGEKPSLFLCPVFLDTRVPVVEVAIAVIP